MELSPQTLTILVLASLTLSVIAVIVLFATTASRRARGEAGPVHLDETLEGILNGQANKIVRIESALRRLAAESRRQGNVLRGAVQHVGMVRYDAFEDVGGRLSFSCALLDDLGDGVVVTSINGRQDTRVYAKPINNGRSSHNLSEEEDAAIHQALAGPREAVSAG